MSTDLPTNAWLAEHVLGWRPLSGREALAQEVGPEHLPPRSRGHVQRVWFRGPGERMACDECGDMPDWVGEDAAALRLLKDIAGSGQHWQITYWPREWEREHNMLYQCGLEATKHGTDHPDWVAWGEANVLAQAICRAIQTWKLAQEG